MDRGMASAGTSTTGPSRAAAPTPMIFMCATPEYVDLTAKNDKK
jgi:hypothetical protein